MPSPDSATDPAAALSGELAGMDIYLLDQVVRGRVAPGATIVDVGVGGGRNLVWFHRAGYDVHGLDARPDTIEALNARVGAPATSGSGPRFRCEPLEHSTFPAAAFDLVIANAVFHFAADAHQFDAMLDGAWRLLAPGGVLFTRLASKIGLEIAPLELGEGRFRLPDGSERFLVDEVTLIRSENRLGALRLDPLKSTNVANLRSMTTWVLGKPADPARS